MIGVGGLAIMGSASVLGVWFQASEGVKLWMQVLTDLKQRGVSDIPIAGC